MITRFPIEEHNEERKKGHASDNLKSYQRIANYFRRSQVCPSKLTDIIAQRMRVKGGL